MDRATRRPISNSTTASFASRASTVKNMEALLKGPGKGVDAEVFKPAESLMPADLAELGISYSASIPEAEAVINECLKQLWKTRRDILLAPPVYLGVQALADSAVVLKVKAEVTEENIFAAQRMLNRELKLAIDAAGIEIPFPQVVVHQAK